MQQPCPQCGFISDRPSRFCRQCGTPLFVENEATSAATRNYAPKQESSFIDQPYISPYAGSLEQQVPNTAELRQPPGGFDPSATRKKSRLWIWLLAGFMCMFLLIAAGLTAFFIGARRVQRAIPPIGEQIEKDIKEKVARELEKVQETSETSAKDHDLTVKDALKALQNLPQMIPMMTQRMPLDLEKYRYPNSDLKITIPIPGNEIVILNTDDDLEVVKKFYQQKFNQSPVQDGSDSEKTIFQIPGSPPVAIVVKPEERETDKTQIVILKADSAAQLKTR